MAVEGPLILLHQQAQPGGGVLLDVRVLVPCRTSHLCFTTTHNLGSPGHAALAILLAIHRGLGYRGDGESTCRFRQEALLQAAPGLGGHVKVLHCGNRRTLQSAASDCMDGGTKGYKPMIVPWSRVSESVAILPIDIEAHFI